MSKSHLFTRSLPALSFLLASAVLLACGSDSTSSSTSTSAGGGSGTTSSDSSSASSGTGGSAAVSTITEARALAEGATATVEGYVTVVPGTFNSATGDQGFAIQDDGAGIYVGLTDLIDLPLDQHVRVTGKLTQVAKQTVLMITKDSVTKLDGPKTIAPVDAKTGDVKEAVEGKLLKVSGKLTKAVVDDAPYGAKVFIDDGSGETQVFVHNVAGKPVIDAASLAMGQQITVVGLGAQYEAAYEVCPRKSDDLTKAP
jgi:DNA/RNA endonuclease YhcR with UshA esterase domain